MVVAEQGQRPQRLAAAEPARALAEQVRPAPQSRFGIERRLELGFTAVPALEEAIAQGPPGVRLRPRIAADDVEDAGTSCVNGVGGDDPRPGPLVAERLDRREEAR